MCGLHNNSNQDRCAIMELYFNLWVWWNAAPSKFSLLPYIYVEERIESTLCVCLFESLREINMLSSCCGDEVFVFARSGITKNDIRMCIWCLKTPNWEHIAKFHIIIDIKSSSICWLRMKYTQTSMCKETRETVEFLECEQNSSVP